MKKVLLMSVAILAVLFLPGCSNSDEKNHTHDFGEWKAIRPATCSKEGIEKRMCSCGEYESRKIEQLAHDIVNVPEVKATCTTKGHSSYEYCNNCDYSTEEKIYELSNHNNVSTTSSYPTCQSSGTTSKVYCQDCGFVSQESKTLTAKTHAYGEDGVCKDCSTVYKDEGLVFSLSKTTYSVTNFIDPNASDVASSVRSLTIPGYYKGLPVASINANAFKNSGMFLKTVKIPQTVVEIGNLAFYPSNISEVYVPISVKTINSNAFGSNTVTIYYEGTLEEWNKVFSGINSMAKIKVIPNSYSY